MNFKIIFIVALTLTVVKSEYHRYDNYKVYSIVPATDKDVKVISELQDKSDYMFWSDVVKEGSDVRIMVAPEKQQDFEDYLKNGNLKATVIIDDVQKTIEAQLRRPAPNRINNEYAWTYYQNFEEIIDWLNKTAAAYPDIVTLVTIGTSVEGRPITGVKIDYKKQENPTIGMLEGGIHAREWISPPTLTWVINEFLTSNEPEIRFLAENVVWHIFPVVNPDGYAYTFTNNRMWRKNRNPANFTSCAQWNIPDDMSNGIDLNRNFGFLWMSIGASTNPCSEVFAGPVENSELETIAIINYVRGLQQQGNLVYYMAFHSFSQMILVPYSHVGGAQVLQAPNYGDMFEIAIKGSDKLRARFGTDYLVGTSSDILYPVSGSSFDWVKGEADVPIVYLFELRDIGQYGFLLPPELIIPNNKETVDALIEMDRVARHMGYYTASGNLLKLNLVLLLLSLFILV